MKGIEALRKSLIEIGRRVDKGVPTTTKDGKPTRIRGQGCGILFHREYLRIIHEHNGEHPALDELPEDFRSQADLWSRAEIDGSQGAISNANRELARRILGVDKNVN